MEAKLVVVPPQTVDDYGDLCKDRAAFALTEGRYQKLHKQLAELAAKGDPETEYIAEGERYTLQISMCKMESTVDIPRARKKLGAAAFLEVCTVTLKALRRFLTEPEVEALTISTRTGSRSYVAVPMAKD